MLGGDTIQSDDSDIDDFMDDNQNKRDHTAPRGGNDFPPDDRPNDDDYADNDNPHGTVDDGAVDDLVSETPTVHNLMPLQILTTNMIRCGITCSSTSIDLVATQFPNQRQNQEIVFLLNPSILMLMHSCKVVYHDFSVRIGPEISPVACADGLPGDDRNAPVERNHPQTQGCHLHEQMFVFTALAGPVLRMIHHQRQIVSMNLSRMKRMKKKKKKCKQLQKG